MNAMRTALVCGLIFVISGVMIGSRSHNLARWDARVMPWVEPGWRFSPRLGQKRLRASTFHLTVDDVYAGGIGAMASVGISISVAVQRTAVIFPALIVGVAAGVWVSQSVRVRSRRRRETLLDDEVPHIADLLALHISAGLSLGQSIRAVAGMAEGAAADLLRGICADLDTGAALGTALRARRGGGSPSSWNSLVEALISCAERGAPVTATVHAQARDARRSRNQRVLADAGRREAAMLIPVVFLTLPATVLVALMPGVAAFRGGW